MGEGGQTPEKGTLQVFRKLVEDARLDDAPQIGNLVKRNLEDCLAAKYHSEDQANSVPALWHRFLKDIREVFPFVVNRKFTDIPKHGTRSEIFADIQELILNKWLKEATLSHQNIAYAAYLISHTQFADEFGFTATEIDFEFLGMPFEEMFGVPMPSTTSGAIELLTLYRRQTLEKQPGKDARIGLDVSHSSPTGRTATSEVSNGEQLPSKKREATTACIPFSKFKMLVLEGLAQGSDSVGRNDYRSIVGTALSEFKKSRAKKSVMADGTASRIESWSEWIFEVPFDDEMERIIMFTASRVMEMRKGHGHIVHSLAAHYRLHEILEDRRWADTIDNAVFGETVEAHFGSPVFSKTTTP